MVVLREVQKSLTGRYRCEVSTDAPHFHTQTVLGYMHVIGRFLPSCSLVISKPILKIGGLLQVYKLLIMRF